MTSEEIRQKARQWLKNERTTWERLPGMVDDVVYVMAGFAESLLSGGADSGPICGTCKGVRRIKKPDGCGSMRCPECSQAADSGTPAETALRKSVRSLFNENSGWQPVGVEAPPAAAGGEHSVIVTKNAAELLRATSGSGTPATPSTPKLRPQVAEWDYESQYEREKAIMDLQEKREQAAIATAIAAEREACAKIAQARANLHTVEGTVASNITAAIRSRASSPGSATGASSPDASGLLAQASPRCPKCGSGSLRIVWSARRLLAMCNVPACHTWVLKELESDGVWTKGEREVNMEVLREFFSLAKRDSATVLEPAESATGQHWTDWYLAKSETFFHNSGGDENPIWGGIETQPGAFEFAEAYAGHLRQQLQGARQEVEHFSKQNLEWAKCAATWQERAEKAEAKLASLKAAEEGWIPCAERLPEPNGQMNSRPMWIWSAAGPDIGAYRWVTKWWVDRYGNAIDDVTHWKQTLPPAPAKPAEGPAAKEGK